MSCNQFSTRYFILIRLDSNSTPFHTRKFGKEEQEVENSFCAAIGICLFLSFLLSVAFDPQHAEHLLKLNFSFTKSKMIC